jgi:AraC-like DNA-binding protein
LYLGPALGLSPHRNAVAVVALTLDQPFDVALDPNNDSAGYRSCRSVLIPPNTLHHLANTAGAMAFLYVDARSRDLERLMTYASPRDRRAGFDLSIEEHLIETLRCLASGAIGWRDAKLQLGESLADSSKAILDPRVQQVLDRLHSDPSMRLPLADLSREMQLSDSRFLHLFKAATGVPFRRYKLWVGMRAATHAITQGDSLTTAALKGGFSSSAHFSAAFREMFGLEPSRFARGQLQYVASD